MRLNIDKENNAMLYDEGNDLALWESSTDPDFDMTEETEFTEILEYLAAEGIIDDPKDVTAIIRETDDENYYPEYSDNPNTLGDFDDGDDDDDDDDEYCEMCGLILDDCECGEDDDD